MTLKENKYPQYNIRLNLGNPYHVRLHQHLKSNKGDIHVSRNEYLVQKLYEGIFGNMEGFPKDNLKEMEERLEKRITKELLKTILGTVGTKEGIVLPSPAVTDSEEEMKKETTDKFDDEVANAALGYFDDWSDEDDE